MSAHTPTSLKACHTADEYEGQPIQAPAPPPAPAKASAFGFVKKSGAAPGECSFSTHLHYLARCDVSCTVVPDAQTAPVAPKASAFGFVKKGGAAPVASTPGQPRMRLVHVLLRKVVVMLQPLQSHMYLRLLLMTMRTQIPLHHSQELVSCL